MGLKQDWILTAKKELEEKDPIKSLTKTWDEFEILPYYNSSDLAFNINRLPGRQWNMASPPNHWLNLPEVDATDKKISDSAALTHLQNGADGIFLKVDERSEPVKVLAEIKPEYCFLGFESVGSSLSFFEKLSEIIPFDKLNGAVFPESESKWLPMASLFKGYNSFRCLGITEAGKGPAPQIQSCVTKAIKVIDDLTDYAFSAKAVFNQLAFTINATPHFFGDVIKIRALRVLLDRLATAYGLANAPSFIRIRVNPIVAEQYQPHGDLLGNSFAAIAAVASSADAVTIKTVNEQSELHNRTMRNMSWLLKEESRLDKVADPFSGSYFIESLTHALVEKVWSKISTEK